jgi:beta-glucosidase
VANWFADYAGAVARKLGDRVELWATLNEPQVFGMLGYFAGLHAPGIADPAKYLAVSHFINLAHGAGVTAIRAERPGVRVGTVLNTPPVHPRSDREADRDAARILDGFTNRWYAEPVLLGRYPDEVLRIIKPFAPPVQEGDLQRIHQPLDFVGLNLYSRIFAYHEPAVPVVQAMIDESYRVSGSAYTDFGWEVYPQAMYEALIRFKEEWGDPVVYVTENGRSRPDEVRDGRAEDPERIEYLAAYLAQVRRAMDRGVKVKGYFVWSLLDNFEWAEGYTKRFGIVHVDFQTLARTLKSSAAWYRDLIASGRYDWEG